MSDPLYFMHIPKTGGMSVTRWLTDVLPAGTMCPAELWDDLAAGRLAELSSYGAFHGHFGDNLDRLLGRSTQVVTVLRDPLERTISHYRHVRRDVSHVWHRRVGGQSFDEFVADPVNRPMIENFQARYLAGLPMDLAPFLAACDGGDRYVGRLTVTIEELGFCLAPEQLRRASMDRLRTACVVGTTQHLAAFCHQVSRTFGIPLAEDHAVPTLNAAGHEYQVQPSNEARATVARLTSIDLALYEQALARAAAWRESDRPRAIATAQSQDTLRRAAQADDGSGDENEGQDGAGAQGWHAHVGEEFRKSYLRRQAEGFFEKYMSGPNILDIGYRGYLKDALPVFPRAIGVEMDYPGYDGRVLPFADESQDAVFTSHVLEHISDYRQAMSEWFRVLRVGGHLVIAVPHQYLYERSIRLPSRFNGDHRRFYTAASLMAEVEDALDPMSYRVRLLEDNDADFDYTIPPENHAGGCYELVLVLQRIRRPDYADALLDGGKPARPYGTGAFLHVAKLEAHEPLLSIETEASPMRVLVLKLDHRGDFINALPAFAALRQGFPDARLTLACGPWMETEAKALGVFDEILPVAFFPEVASAGHDGNFHDDGTSRFEAIVADRRWDLAIDLRVDRDTRHLLAKVDAAHRAGFGTAIEFPFLDIFLPYQNPTVEGRAYRQMLAPTSFTAAIGEHAGYAIIHEADLQTRQAADFLVFGPYLTFEPGHWTFEVLIEPTARDFVVHFDICADQGRQLIMVGKLDVSANRHPRFAITLVETVERMEIRLRAAATGVLPPFRFLGMRCYRPGILPALHQQEMQLLLASLVGLRMKAPYVVHEIAA